MTATRSILGKEDFNNVGAATEGVKEMARLLEIMWIMYWAYGCICKTFCSQELRAS